MGLNDLIYWYYKKIGTYDKQQWEKTVEQRIFGGLNNVPMRTAKLKTEFIDVDLVRGSSFPKAKPKHGLSTVTWLAVKRLLLLPLYKNWWIQQTTSRIFSLFCLLYCLQIFNICLYVGAAEFNESDIVSLAEILMPVAMMFFLCIVHSQIVSTNSGPTITPGRNKSRIRRSRNERNRPGKLRPRRNTRVSSDIKNPQDTINENVKIYANVPPSVRFAKKVCIDTPLVESKVQLEDIPSQASFDELKIDKNSLGTSPIQTSVKNDNLLSGDAVVNGRNDDNIHQEDDGFESLNSNVLSDNDRTNSERIKNENDKSKCVTSANSEERLITYSSDNSQNIAPVAEISRKTDIDLKKPSNSISSNGLSTKSIERMRQFESEEEGECEETGTQQLTEATTSATEWMGVTTNSDECSYSSDLNESQANSDGNFNYGEFVEHPFSWELELPPSILLNSACNTSDRVSCTIWTRRDIKKAELSVLDISSAIIARAETMPETMDYFYGGLILSIVLAVIPAIRRLSNHLSFDGTNNSTGSTLVNDIAQVGYDTYSEFFCKVIDVSFGTTLWERSVILILSFERLILSCLLFFLLAVAERTFKQRLLYAKLFSHLTSSRRARKSDLPHFRLNKVRNIKTWLSVRSYLKRRGPQRSVDVIVSAVFLITLLLLSFVSLELIKDLESLHSRYNIEALFWSFALGIYILRFMTLGTKINKKYRNLSVLITEQINLYLQIEQKPHKKDELMVANSVLKLAADLIKELESPFKISGLSANPYLYTITKVVLLSALSAVLSELLGFKLKLYKITIN
ncbi:putative homeodomain transcription factor isoform X2 [Chelonus insularis]|uniref:putative homeodomain transcription factor isoform X2 n=1 Tax=Chelonus insularis TaxID=460826 RepID=UPI0015897FE1|nr:putative homeodomain transcription factor isoform X2 [Chelonus insularis]